jgi:acyl dehydratase
VKVSSLTGGRGYFEDFTIGQQMRHFRAATIDEVENNFITKQVMNTAQVHWNEHAMAGSPLGEGRLVFGLVTASMVVGLVSEDTAEQSLAELGIGGVRFTSPVHHGDTITAYTEVLSVDDADRDDAGVVGFRHWGCNQHGVVVCQLDRRVLLKRRSHWGDR